MAAAEVELKSPLIPLFSKGEISLWESNPSLEKGKGRFTRNDAGILQRITQDTRLKW
jgi:hypothetical protein